jgi:hypothetical protein
MKRLEVRPGGNKEASNNGAQWNAHRSQGIGLGV